jgi:peroxiredoxin
MKFAVLLCVLGLGLSRAFAGEGDIVVVGQKAPGFSGMTTEGAAVKLEDYAGKVVLLDFFATWCPPCMSEMPHLESELWQPYKDKGLVLLAIGREHTREELTKFKAAKHFSFPIVADPSREIFGKYATSMIPRCYLIGKDGKVLLAVTGFDPADFAKLKDAVAKELAR